MTSQVVLVVKNPPGKEAGRVVHSPFGKEGVLGLGLYIPLWGREK